MQQALKDYSHPNLNQSIIEKKPRKTSFIDQDGSESPDQDDKPMTKVSIIIDWVSSTQAESSGII